MSNPTLKTLLSVALLALLFSGCKKDDPAPAAVGQTPTSVTAIVVSGTTNEACVVRVNGLADSDALPNSFRTTISVSEPSSGTVSRSLVITATDPYANSSTLVIDITMTK